MPAELEPSKLAKFLRRVEDGYNDTPYHSKAHAADVLQSMHTLLTLGGLASRMGDELIMLAGLLSAWLLHGAVAYSNSHRLVLTDTCDQTCWLAKACHPLRLLLLLGVLIGAPFWGSCGRLSQEGWFTLRQ